ncbi:MAG: ABC transporter permease [Spirochaetaceae bacterium]|nr:ABC transporter permease [Spirochaetaceae bacterium]
MANIKLKIGLILIILITLLVILLPALSPYSAHSINVEKLSLHPSWQHPLGTDRLGRDYLTRLFLAGRLSLSVALFSALLTTLLGLIVGLSAALLGGKADKILMRLAELISSLPFIPLAIILMAFLAFQLDAGSKTLFIVLLIALLSWPSTARLMRGNILHLKNEDYLLIATAMQLNLAHKIKYYALPAILPQLAINSAVNFGRALTSEATLSFLGLGFTEPLLSWGTLLAAGRSFDVLTNQYYMWLSSAILLIVALLAVNLIAESARTLRNKK